MRVEDAFGNLETADAGTEHPVSIGFKGGGPAGVLLGTLTRNDVGGVATFGDLVIDEANNGYVLEATSTGLALTDSLTFKVTPGATSQLVFSGLATPTTAGNAESFTVTAEDQLGNVTPSYSGTVHYTSTDPQATLPGNAPFAGSSVTGLVTLKTAGSQTVSAQDTAMGSTISGTSSGVTVDAAATTHVVFSGLSASATAGSAGAFTLTAEDQFNNPTPGYAGLVHFTSSDSRATLPPDALFAGPTLSSSVTFETAGSQTVSAQDTVAATITGTSGSVTVDPAATSQFVFTGLASAVTVNAATTFTLTAEDAFGNITPSYTGTVHFTSTDGAMALPADYTFVAGDNGVHPGFSATFATAGSQTITATDSASSTITGTSGTVTVS
jgi:hypothetical protein